MTPDRVTQGYGLWSITTIYNDDLVAPYGGYGQMLNPIEPSSVPDPYPPDDPTNGGPTSGPRWQPASMIPAQLADGNAWVARHPAGL